MKLNKKLIYSMIIILTIPLGLYIYDRSYIYPPIFFFDTNPVMIKLFKNKDNVNKADKYGITPLMKAVSMRNKKSVKLLLEKGADPNYVVDWLGEAYPDNWIMYTFLMNHMNRDKKENEDSIIRKLPLKFKIMKEITNITGYDRWPIGFVDSYPAGIACNGNEYEILKLLIENKSIVPSLLDISSYKKGETEKILKFLLSKGKGNNKDGVICALEYADIEIAELFLKSGINPNIAPSDNLDYKNTPLYMSVSIGDTEKVRLLLQYGADIYLKDENGGESAFEYVQNNRNEIKKEIVEMIDRVEEENNRKAVFHALAFGDIKTAELFLKSGMNPNIVATDNSTYKTTPLYMSLKFGDTERVNLLLKYRADIHLKDENGGESAFDYVQNNRNEIKKEIVEMIDRVEEENKKKNR